MIGREAKLIRMQDLITINMKGTYNKSFNIRTYYTGFRFQCTSGNDRFEYVERY